MFAVPEATAEGLKQVSHSIPVLAFYGNWTDASMFEAGSWLEYSARLDTRWPYMGWITCNYITGTSAGSGSQYNWGGNPETLMWDREDYLPERASLNNQNGDALCQYFVSPILQCCQCQNADPQCGNGRDLQAAGVGLPWGQAFITVQPAPGSGCPSLSISPGPAQTPRASPCPKGPWQRFR